jgi:hypothetical protein
VLASVVFCASKCFRASTNFREQSGWSGFGRTFLRCGTSSNEKNRASFQFAQLFLTNIAVTKQHTTNSPKRKTFKSTWLLPLEAVVAHLAAAAVTVVVVEEEEVAVVALEEVRFSLPMHCNSTKI